MNKYTLKNRKGKNIVIVVNESPKQKGLAFIMHGLHGNKNEKHIVALSEAFVESNMTNVRFDTSHTFGESEGNPEKATITNYYEDLEDVINWAKNQNW